MKESEQETALLADPSVSYWLKEQIRASRDRDILDALADAEKLADVLKSRLGETNRRERPGPGYGDLQYTPR